MRKIILILSLCLIIIVSFIGCGKQSKPSNTPTNVIPKDPSITTTQSQNKTTIADTSAPSQNTTIPANNITGNSSKKVFSQEDALEIVESYAGKMYNIHFDHIQNEDGKDYYVFQQFESLKGDSSVGMSNTQNWFYVEKETGKLYRLDIDKNKLEFIK